jgi:hypothetical protein
MFKNNLNTYSDLVPELADSHHKGDDEPLGNLSPLLYQHRFMNSDRP